MTPDDAHTSHNHGFELPNVPRVSVREDARPWRAVAGVAVCLGLAGIITGLIVARRQSASDEHITSEALQREELRDGWKALGAAAERDAHDNDPPSPTAASANAAPAPPNVVIVNVPAQSASAVPANVTNITLPNGPYTGSNVAATDGSGANPAFVVPNQSLPPVNFSPVQGYLPTQQAYPSSPSTYTPQTNYSPQNSYGATPPSVAPTVGNGSIPGSSPNPALPNNGLVGSTPLPSVLPNGSTGGGVTPSTPVAPAPASPNTPTLPSGFSAP